MCWPSEPLMSGVQDGGRLIIAVLAPAEFPATSNRTALPSGDPTASLLSVWRPLPMYVSLVRPAQALLHRSLFDLEPPFVPNSVPCYRRLRFALCSFTEPIQDHITARKSAGA